VPVGVSILVVLRRLEGPSHNVLPQALIGCTTILFVLAAYLLRFHPEQIEGSPARIGILVLTLFGLTLTLVHVESIRPLVTLPYDLANWSEPEFVVDIIKWRTGAPLYGSPDDSNSNSYTFLAPALTYFLARVAGHPQSIPMYRLIQQIYLALSALLAAAAAWNLLLISDPNRLPRMKWLWLAFFSMAAFLIAGNPQTGAYNIVLHNEALGWLVSTFAFWLLTQYFVSRSTLWLWIMAGVPPLGFLTKQYLAVWALIYAVAIWFEGRLSRRNVILFGGSCFAAVLATIGICVIVWGANFRYWVFQVLGNHAPRLSWILYRFSDASPYLALGLFGGLVLLRGPAAARMLSLWVGWIVMVLPALYTSGITFAPTHLGPATMVGACFGLAAIARLFPGEGTRDHQPAQQWLTAGLVVGLVVSYFAGLGYLQPTDFSVSPDLSRYVRSIEKQFEGLPVQKVLLDTGDWIYLRHDVLMKDRGPLLAMHRVPHYGLNERLRNQEYSRILLAKDRKGRYEYDPDLSRGITRELQAHYHEICRIPGVEHLWANAWLAEIVVLEPLPASTHGGMGVVAESPSSKTGLSLCVN
jgi:hypothetical protein